MLLRRSDQGESLPNLEKAHNYLQAESNHPSRRKFIQLLGGVAAGYALADKGVEHWAGEAYHSRGTSLRVVGGQNIQSNLFAVSFGGEGNYDDYYGAKAIFEASGKRIPTADMIYDNAHGLNFDDMARVLQKAQRERQFEYLVVNGDSLGAMFGLFAAYKAGLPVAGFIANSGPMKLGDAKRGAVLTADILTSPMNPDDSLLHNAELAAKDLYCDIRDNGWRGAITGLPDEISTLPDQMASGGSPELQLSQLRWAKRIDFPQLTHALARKGIISKQFTSPVFVEASQDNVINPGSAYHDWSHEFERFGMHMTHLEMAPGSYHADVFTEGAPLQRIGYFEHIINRVDLPQTVVT